MEKLAEYPKNRKSSWWNLMKLVIPSGIGILFFFVPIEISGRSTILLDHLVRYCIGLLGDWAPWYALAVITAGALYPFITGSWRHSTTNLVFTLLKVAGVVFMVMAMSGVGPALLHEADKLPFLLDKLVVPVSLIVPIGAIFLALLTTYGLLELVGVICQPLMRPLWKTPGRSAIDAVASFVGSYSIGLLITNRVYTSGMYSNREAAIIATGFSTASVTFMIVVANTLDIMHVWLHYFWLTLLITFLITAITARIPPISRMSTDVANPEPMVPRGERLSSALRAGLEAAERAPSLQRNVFNNGREGLLMAMSILPSIMSVGLIGLLVANYTPVFDWLGYALYPFVLPWGLDDGLMLAQATASGLAELFLPALQMTEASFVARFATAIVSISSILFFSASIPCILSTNIPISIPQLLAIWFIRTAIGLFLAIPAGYLVLFLAG
ncbi:YjiH family protein [Halomonas sp. M5N1S17]|uniref:YjiH family protein n=1 Tax=Halomonas alkalisoli TaxID=2907158 RepID=UPI001F3B9744|nr:YjiH family protein [Halomonas alkalisoli]MCE9663923.1 YjiH family protein [Halomonas alkalisoli]